MCRFSPVPGIRLQAKVEQLREGHATRGSAGEVLLRLMGVGLLIGACCAHFAPVAAAGDDDALKEIVEADAATRAALKSGLGKAAYEFHGKREGEKELVLRKKGTAMVAFSGEKYRLRFDYEDKNSRDTAQVVMTDGTALFTNQITPLQKPHGAEAEVWDFSDGDTTPYRANLTFHPVRMASGVVQLGPLMKEKEIAVERLRDGSVRGRLRKDSWSAEFTASPQAGMHIVSLKVYEKKGDHLYEEYRAEWARSDGVWYVKSFTNDFYDLDGSGWRTTFAYDTFEANAKVEPVLFEFPALQLPLGARVIDRRPGAKPNIYYNTLVGKADGEKVEPLLEHLKKLTPYVE